MTLFPLVRVVGFKSLYSTFLGYDKSCFRNLEPFWGELGRGNKGIGRCRPHKQKGPNSLQNLVPYFHADHQSQLLEIFPKMGAVKAVSMFVQQIKLANKD
jgi:hypothetical protein